MGIPEQTLFLFRIKHAKQHNWSRTDAAEHCSKHMQTAPPYLKCFLLFIHVITIPSILFGDNVKPGIALTQGGPLTSQEWMQSIFHCITSQYDNICGSISSSTAGMQEEQRDNSM
jgi:hypothetical protein